MKSFDGKFGLYNYDTSLFYRNDRTFEGEVVASSVKKYLRAKDKLDNSNKPIKTGGLVLLASSSQNELSIREGNSFGEIEKIEGNLQESSYELGCVKLSYAKHSKADKIRVLVELEGKIFHADEKGNEGKFEGYERWYKNTAIRVEAQNSFAEVSAFSVIANNANANFL